MKISIDENICKLNNMSPEELVAGLLVKLVGDVDTLFNQMVEKKILVRAENTTGNYLITSRWNDIVETIILDSDKDSHPVNKVEKLAIQLQALFPEGKKEGTTQYWRGNKREISLKLKKFFKLYGNSYTDQQIIDATKNYVTSFNGKYAYMRVLKYFILKDERKETEDGGMKVVEVSDLANYIENAGAKETLNDEWTSTLN